MNAFLKKTIFLYRLIFSPFLGGRCRFYPSCSEYALETLNKHSWWRAVYLTTCRLLRCHPFGGSGVDLVP